MSVSPPSLGQRFRARHQAEWERYDEILATLERRRFRTGMRRGFRGLSAEELAELPILHREVQSALLQAREAVLDQALLAYLEELVRRGQILTQREPMPVFRGLREILLHDFPVAIREIKGPLLLSAGLFFFGAFLAAAICRSDETAFFEIVDPALSSGRGPESPPETLRETLYDEQEAFENLRFSGQLISNNSTIGFLAIGVGLVFGLPTGLLLLSNAMMVGAFSWLFASKGLALEFYGWILPHGIPEIFAILICCAAGFEIARGFVWPGPLSRMESLMVAGQRVVAIGIGAFVLFIYAGVIEGTFRQAVTHDGVRYAVATVHAVLLWIWVSRGGRGTP